MDTYRSGRVKLLLTGVAALVLALSPGSALAGGEPQGFTASGIFMPGTPAWTITEGDVTAAGSSGRFVVKNRLVTGFVTDVSAGGPDLAGPFQLDFGANVPLATQSGQIHGRLTFGDADAPDYEASVRASSSLTAGPGIVCLTDDCAAAVGAVTLAVTGSFTFVGGTAQGHGPLVGSVTAALDQAGHLLFLLPSGLPIFDLSIMQGVVRVIGVTSTQLIISGK
jgi:hypothetical protein